MPVFAPPAVVSEQASPPRDTTTDVIEVVGTRAAQAQKIDRRTYAVQTNPNTAQKDTVQLLRGLPAVSIGPDDSISLLGAGARVTVDGQDYRGDLKTIHGSDIEKIEIITNPSAQYAAQGTGGIINLILRKKKSDGVSGNASIEGGSLGSLDGNASLKVKRGKTRLELSPFFRTGVYDRSTTKKVRFVYPVRGGAPIGNGEEISGRSRQRLIATSATIARDLNDRSSISIDGFIGVLNSGGDNHSDLRALTPGFASYSQDQTNRRRFQFVGANLNYNHKGKREGELLTASLGLFGNPTTDQYTTTVTSDGRRIASFQGGANRFINLKLDWTHPIGTRRILSLGAETNGIWQHSRYLLETSGAGALPFAVADDYRGTNDTAALYATFQQRFGSWTFLPGLRVETNRRAITRPAAPRSAVSRTDFFPSLHLEHPIGKDWVVTLSRSSRIDRVGIDLLRPYPIQRDPLLIEYGNPALRDARTSAYEASFHYHRKKIDAGLIVYDRLTNDVIGSRYTVNAAGQNVTSPINAGRRRDRGAQADVSLPLLARTKAQWSGNLFDSRVPIDIDAGATLSTLRTTSKLILEYDGPERKGVPGDVIQLLWTYEGRLIDYQIRRRAWHQLSLSATHNLDKRWALTATADSGPLGYGSRLDSPFVREDLRTTSRASLKLKLMRNFGTR